MARKANGKTPPSLDPDEIATRSFDSARRGYEPDEVRAFLELVAEQFRVLTTRLAVLERRAHEAEERAAEASRIDEDRLADALGEQVKEIYDAARRAATEMREQAAEQAAAAVRDSQQRAQKADAEAEKRLAARIREAEQHATAIVERAEKRKAQIDARVEQIKGTATEQSDALVAEAKDQGRRMIEEAKVVRRRILADLAKRRKGLATQIEQLRAGREQLLSSLESVRESATEATAGLEGALPAARAAAERAGRQAESAAEISVEQLEAMIDGARDAGMVDPQPESSDDADQLVAASGSAGVESAEAAPESPAGVDGQQPGSGSAEATEEPERAASARRRRRRRGPSVDEIDPEDTAPAPEAGRKSSAVRVFRLGTDEGDRDEQPRDEVAEQRPVQTEQPAPEPEEPAGEPVEAPAVVASEQPTEHALVAEPEPEPEPEPEAEAEAEAEAPEVAAVDDESRPAREVDGEGREVITNLFARIRADNETVSGSDTQTATEQVLPLTAAAGDSGGTGKRARRGDRTPVDEVASEPPSADTDATSEPDDTVVARAERRDEALAGIERGLGRAMKRVLADEQNAILDAVRPKKRQKRTELDDILPGAEEHAMRYAVAAKSELRGAVRAGAQLAGGEAPSDTSVDDLAAAMALAVSRPLRERVDQAFAGSENPDALASDLRSLYREWKSDRVDQCAREFSAEAFNRGVRLVDADPASDLLAPAEGHPELTAR